MSLDLTKWGPATVLVVAVCLIAVAAGAVVTIVNPGELPFSDYLDALWKFALAAAGLGAARAHAIKKTTEAGHVDDAAITATENVPDATVDDAQAIPRDTGDSEAAARDRPQP